MNETQATTKTKRGPKPVIELLFRDGDAEYFPKWKRIHRSVKAAECEFDSINEGLMGAGFPGHGAYLYGTGLGKCGMDLKAPAFDPEA